MFSKPLRLVQIVFDDGWRGTFEAAAETLAICGLHATVFVTTGLIGHSDFADAKMLAEADPELLSIGAHSVSHRLLSHLSEDEIRAELRDSKRRLEDILGREVDAMSAPGGATDERVERIAAECGYRLLYTSVPVINRPLSNPLRLGRVAIRSDTDTAMLQRYLRHNLRRERWAGAARSVPRRLLGERAYEFVRRRLLGEQPGQGDMDALRAQAPH